MRPLTYRTPWSLTRGVKIFNKFKGTKGFISTWERVIRFRDMITKTALKRTEILAFWSKHGISATLEAFKVKRRTLLVQPLDFQDVKYIIISNHAPRETGGMTFIALGVWSGLWRYPVSYPIFRDRCAFSHTQPRPVSFSRLAIGKVAQNLHHRSRK